MQFNFQSNRKVGEILNHSIKNIRNATNSKGFYSLGTPCTAPREPVSLFLWLFRLSDISWHRISARCSYFHVIIAVPYLKVFEKEPNKILQSLRVYIYFLFKSLKLKVCYGAAILQLLILKTLEYRRSRMAINDFYASVCIEIMSMLFEFDFIAFQSGPFLLSGITFYRFSVLKAIMPLWN